MSITTLVHPDCRDADTRAVIADYLSDPKKFSQLSADVHGQADDLRRNVCRKGRLMIDDALDLFDGMYELLREIEAAGILFNIRR